MACAARLSPLTRRTGTVEPDPQRLYDGQLSATRGFSEKPTLLLDFLRFLRYGWR